MADSARVIENEIDRRKSIQDDLQSRADVDEINRRIVAHDEGAAKTYTREETKKILEDMGYRG